MMKTLCNVLTATAFFTGRVMKDIASLKRTSIAYSFQLLVFSFELTENSKLDTQNSKLKTLLR
ncbi:exported hypothetical protein [Syntrophobacter sp. SbD1]|nr:exported hypothetical protein [Syntrophobacter sp. SbD1]